ncbi:histidine phosphatase family protein [Kineosporia sp. J2-2]|uniref:Histidine phosphatase family protein n=1 Tax=Kineosporia corallincola TaxID=2835133 RepID=A0ABS5TLH3_9ACTN|nr:histidine phosphatase family protein [Kineosporia corallincola]MBT0770454.1 histidine phosphatase family protein [Kineosporia corallincola]
MVAAGGSPHFPPVHLLLVRHGQQERDGQNGALTALGREQAAATGAVLGLTEHDRLVSSTRLRAVETALAFGREPEQVADLDEFRFGPDWTWDDADKREDLVLWRPHHRTPGGESLLEFQRRVQGAMTALVARPPEGRLVVVTHAAVTDAVLRWLFGLAPDAPWTFEVSVPHASITELHHWPKKRHPAGAPRHTFLLRLGDVTHLPPGLVTGE